MYDLHAFDTVVWIGVEDPVEFPALDVENEHGAGVIRPWASHDEATLLVEAGKECTMCWTRGEAIRRGGKGEFDDQHAAMVQLEA